MADDQHVEIDYTNWRGARRFRVIRPTGNMFYGTCEPWHTELQWLLEAIDVEDGKTKLFAMNKIHNWCAASD